MRQKISKAAVMAAAAISVRAVQATAWGAPAYTIVPFSPVGTDTIGTGQGISPSGNFATGFTQRSTGSNGVLYNIGSGATTVQAQNGIIYGTNTVENYGVPFSVNNSGVMFGSSGATSTVQTGAPTVWDGGAAYNLPLPLYSGAGQVYGCNNSNLAVGSVGSASGGLNQAALFHYFGPNSTSNFTSDLTQGTSDGGTLQAAFGINDSFQIVGTASEPSNAAITSGFFLDLGKGVSAATIIPTSSATYNSTLPLAISNNGLVTGSESLYGSSGVPFLYNSSSGATVQIPLPLGASQGGARGVNSSGEVVGTASSAYALPYLYDGTGTYLLSSLLVNNGTGAWHLSDNTSSGAFGIADNGDIVGRGYYNGVLTGFVMIPTGNTVVVPQAIYFNNANGSGNGTTWDGTQQNFNNGSSPVVFNGTAGDFVTFDDNNNGHYTVTVPSTVTPGTTIINNSSGNYTFNGSGGIGGPGGLLKLGTGTLTLNTVNTYALTTSVGGGSLIIHNASSLPKYTNLNVNGTGATLIEASTGTPYASQVGYINAYNGIVDVTTNGLVVHSSTLTSVNTLVKSGYGNGTWNGTSGIISSTAATAGSPMSVGVILNDNGAGTSTPLYGAGGAIGATFLGSTPVDGDILVRCTYTGDANLDGKIDGSDYSRIDVAYAADRVNSNSSTGWFNGDFNYDGTVDGSDYTLIDNSFNNQRTALGSAALVAEISAQVSAVPEPASVVAVSSVLGVSLIGRRLRRRSA